MRLHLRGSRSTHTLGPVLLALSCTLTSCSVVGVLGGASRHRHAAKSYQRAEPAAVFTLPRNTMLALVLTDGTRVEGMLRRATLLDDSAYVVRYEEWRSTRMDSTSSPAIGERLTVKTLTSTQRNVRFRGGLPNALVTESSSGRWVATPWDRVSALRNAQGRDIPLESLRQSDPGRPDLNCGTVRVSTLTDDRTIAFQGIAGLEVAAPDHSTLFGFLIGASVDAAILFVMGSHNLIGLGP